MTEEPNTPADKRARHDWAAIKQRYVEGYEIDGRREANPTHEDLSAHFGIHVSVLKKAAMREKWTDERELFQKRLEDARREKTTEVLASKGAEFDALSLRAAEKHLKMIERMLDKAEKAGDTLTPNQIQALAGGLKQGQHVGRLVMGDSTDNARLYAELLQKPDLSMLSPAELEQLEQLLTKAKPAAP